MTTMETIEGLQGSGTELCQEAARLTSLLARLKIQNERTVFSGGPVPLSAPMRYPLSYLATDLVAIKSPDQPLSSSSLRRTQNYREISLRETRGHKESRTRLPNTKGGETK
jgi:hypothetical protein